MVELFEHPLSPYARKVKILLYEKGIPFERRFVNPLAGSDDPVLRCPSSVSTATTAWSG